MIFHENWTHITIFCKILKINIIKQKVWKCVFRNKFKKIELFKYKNLFYQI